MVPQPSSAKSVALWKGILSTRLTTTHCLQILGNFLIKKRFNFKMALPTQQAGSGRSELGILNKHAVDHNLCTAVLNSRGNNLHIEKSSVIGGVGGGGGGSQDSIRKEHHKHAQTINTAAAAAAAPPATANAHFVPLKRFSMTTTTTTMHSQIIHVECQCRTRAARRGCSLASAACQARGAGNGAAASRRTASRQLSN